MKLRFTPAAIRAFARDPLPVQNAYLKQVAFLQQNLLHPSLRAKKYDEERGIWQARVTRGWRFYFLIGTGAYLILDLIPHPK